MKLLLRRLFWLALLIGAAYAGWSLWQRRTAPSAAGAPVWPPLERPATPSPDSVATSAAHDDRQPATSADAEPVSAETDGGERWIEPVEGACPASHPIKANDNSGIYHVPGGRFYERTGPERCYARAEDAEADGYRASKS